MFIVLRSLSLVSAFVSSESLPPPVVLKVVAKCCLVLPEQQVHGYRTTIQNSNQRGKSIPFDWGQSGKLTVGIDTRWLNCVEIEKKKKQNSVSELSKVGHRQLCSTLLNENINLFQQGTFENKL